jgi:hypothetical protein
VCRCCRMSAAVCARKIDDRPDCAGVGEDESVAIKSQSKDRTLRQAVAPGRACHDRGNCGVDQPARLRTTLASPIFCAAFLRSSTVFLQMNIASVKVYCLSSSLHHRHSPTHTLLLCSLFNVRISAVSILQRPHLSCAHSPTLFHYSCAHSSTLSHYSCAHSSPFPHGRYCVSSKTSLPLIRHLILSCKSPIDFAVRDYTAVWCCPSCSMPEVCQR